MLLEGIDIGSFEWLVSNPLTGGAGILEDLSSSGSLRASSTLSLSIPLLISLLKSLLFSLKLPPREEPAKLEVIDDLDP